MSDLNGYIFPPPKPLARELRSSYALLAFFLIFIFAVSHGFNLYFKSIIQEGFFFSKSEGLVDFKEFNADKHWLKNGKYPTCHELYETTKNISRFDKANTTEEPEDETDFSKQDPFNTLSHISKILPTAHNLILSSIILLIGCKHSVWLVSHTDNADDKEDIQSLQKEEAFWAPVFGSCLLFSLFLVYKYLPQEYIDIALAIYIGFICVTSIFANFNNFVALFKNKKQINHQDSRVLLSYKFERKIYGIDLTHSLTVTGFDVFNVLLSCLIAFIYEYLKRERLADGTKDTVLSAALNNFLGISFCLLALKQVNLSEYKTGAILLVGLFFYDVFWVFFSESVFGSNVMVSVATKVDAPVKFLFLGGIDVCREPRFNMLGLGDVVVPGILLSFLAKYDCYRDFKKSGKSKNYQSSFLFFNVSMYSITLNF